MITKEQLVEISNKFTLNKEIEDICFTISKKMKESAHSGLRAFQIECIKPKGPSMACGTNGQNYHYVFVKEGHSINQYSDKIIECFMKNGFTYNDIESAAISNDYYSSIQLTVR